MAINTTKTNCLECQSHWSMTKFRRAKARSSAICVWVMSSTNQNRHDNKGHDDKIDPDVEQGSQVFAPPPSLWGSERVHLFEFK